MNEDLAKQLSDILKEKNIDLNQVLENFNSNSSNGNTENKESSSFNNSSENNQSNSSGQIDPSTLLKFQKLFTLLNNKKDSKDEQLLRSLKPYMRDSKKEKIDQYIQLLHMLKLFENFQEMGGNLNDFL